jgi:hypothetical protein
VTALKSDVTVPAWFTAVRASATPAFLIITNRGLLLYRRRLGTGPRWRLFQPIGEPIWSADVVRFKCHHTLDGGTLWLALYTTTSAAAVTAELNGFGRIQLPRAAWSQTFAS